MAPEDIPWLLRPPVRWVANRLARRARPQPCPKCDTLVTIPLPVPDTLWETRLDCTHCGHAMALPELAGDGAGARVEELASAGLITANKPESTRILQAETSAERVWEIPAKGGINFFVVFGTVWLLFCSIFNYAVFFGKVDGDMPRWGAFLFVSVFDAVGLVILFAGLRMAFSRHRLRLSATEFVHERRLLGHTRRVSMSPSSIERVELVVFYSQNYEPVYGIEVHDGQRKMRFGSDLEADEKAWLCQDIRAALGIEAEMKTGPLFAQNEKETVSPPDDPPAEVRVALPQARGLIALWVVGAVFVLLPGFMLVKGIDFMEFGRDGLFFVLWNAFAVFWFLGPVLFVLIGVAILFFAWKQSRTEIEIVATRDALTILTRTGAQRREERWGVHEVQAVRADTSVSWRTNGDLKSASALYIVLPDRVRCLGTGQPPAELETAASKLRRALGLDASA